MIEAETRANANEALGRKQPSVVPHAMNEPQPDELEQMRQRANADGSALHAKIATRFREAGWTVLLSPYYLDNDTGQARGIDLICESAIPYQLKSGGTGVLRLQLFVECKSITTPVLFWFDKRNPKRTLDWLHQNTPFRNSMPGSQRKHRYVSTGPGVAKLFKSEESQDPIHKAVAQSLGALIKRRGAQPLQRLDPRLGTIKAQRTVVYPVIVCADGPGFYRTDIGDAGTVTPAPELFQFEVDCAHTTDGKVTDEYFLIDIVRFTTLDIFLKTLDIEIEEATLLLAKQ